MVRTFVKDTKHLEPCIPLDIPHIIIRLCRNLHGPTQPIDDALFRFLGVQFRHVPPRGENRRLLAY